MNLADLNNELGLRLNNWQKQIVLGTLLGSGHLARPNGSKNYHLVIRQSKKQDVNWFAYKVAELKSFGRRRAIQEDRYNWIWTSVSHPCWTEYYDLCYREGRKHITMECLDTVRDTSMMAMFCDKGKIDDNNLAVLRVSHLGSEFSVAEKYFSEYCGMPCMLDGSCLKFTELGTQKLVATIQHRMPVYMLKMFKRS